MSLERIVAVCGGVLMDGGKRALIPGPDHSPGDRSVSLLKTEEGRILIHCFSPKDDWRTVRASLLERGLLAPDDRPVSRKTASQGALAEGVQPEAEARIARARMIWDDARAIAGSVAERYLLERAIPRALTRSAALRFHPHMTSLDDKLRRPALLAAITDRDERVQGVQITLLSPHGASKAGVATPRRVIGRLLGGVVRLADAAGVLAIGEGVETVLSASAAFGIPGWAALSAHNLSMFDPPARMSQLVIAADNDAAGLAAAKSLSARLQPLVPIEVRLPENGRSDWNDAAIRRPSR